MLLGEDIKHVEVALACGTVVSLFSCCGVGWSGSAAFQLRCEFRGGRWAIGVLITLAVHLLVIETVKTLVVLIKGLGKRISKRNSRLGMSA